MRHLTIVTSDPARAPHELGRAFVVNALALSDVAQRRPDALVFVDVELNNASSAEQLRAWLARRAQRGATIFAVDKASRIQAMQAYALGATDLVYRPVCKVTLAQKLLWPGAAGRLTDDERRLSAGDGVVAGLTALQKLFAATASGAPLNPHEIARAGETLVDHIGAYGFGDWVKVIRIHDDQTYQHCMLVAGAAAAFAQHLGFNNEDRTRVAMAGLLHDAGKAMIPVELLQAPRKLTTEEMNVVKQHPEFGYAALKDLRGMDLEMLDVVLHHHEYLDGSGYPHGLAGREIPDLTRILTIADVFGALIEHRPYRPPMSARAAFDVLLGMGDKLDRDLVRGFLPLSRADLDPS